MKIIKRAMYRCLWAVSVWTDAKSMKILIDLSTNDPMFIDGRYENEIKFRSITGRSRGFTQQ